MRVSTAIIILNWNGWRDTLACLRSISLLKHESYAVIVVDNASTDGSAEFIQSWPVLIQEGKSGYDIDSSYWQIISENDLLDWSAPLQSGDHIFIQASHNGGFAFGNNLGIRLALAAECEYVWLLNNDTVVEPEALSALIHRTMSSPRIGMCGSVLRFFDRPEKIQVVGGVRFHFWLARGEQLGQGLYFDDPIVTEIAKCEPDYIAGASMFLTREFIQDVGLMDEGYFLYFEEIDWAIRARPRWDLATAHDSVVFHKEGASIGTSSRNRRSPLSQYYLSRNLIRFYAKRVPVLWPIAFIRISFEVISQLINRDWELARVTFKALRAAVYGECGKSTW